MPILQEASAKQELFGALADATRRTIIELLATRGQMSATDIYDNFIISHPAVSQHLKVLRNADMVRIEKNAQRHLYSLNTATMHKLEDWIAQTTEMWEDRFGKLDEVLEAEKRNSPVKRR